MIARRSDCIGATLLGRRYGGSSGTNFVAHLQLAAAMRQRSERYAETLFDTSWLTTRGIDLSP